MPSAVLDSTVLISAFLAQGGVSNELLRHARAGAFLLCLSAEILDEAQGVLLDNAESSDLFGHDQMCFTLTAIVGIL